MSNIYIREAIVPLEEVLPYVAVGVLPSPMGCDYTHTGKPYRVYYEQKVYLNSLRYQTFVTSGIRCVACGLEGQYFALERCLSRQERQHFENKSQFHPQFHLNMYGLRDGREILFTKDHIKPRSKGGKDQLVNLQTMCSPCNNLKGSHPVAEPRLLLKEKFRRLGQLEQKVGKEISWIKAEGKKLHQPETLKPAGGLQFREFHLYWDQRKKVLWQRTQRLLALRKKLQAVLLISEGTVE